MRKMRNFILILILFCSCFDLEIFAQTGRKLISVRIEGTDRTLLEQNVFADTFLEAVQRAGEKAEISVIVGQNEAEKWIESVEGLVRDTFEGGGWYGYVVREQNRMQQSQFLDMPLESGDEVILYYGSPEKTKIINGLESDLEGNKLILSAKNTYQKWELTDGKMQSKEVVEEISGIRIHLETPDGKEKFVLTDAKGKAEFILEKTGYYCYYGEKYQTNDLPGMVKTKKNFLLYGVKNPDAITRGEFAALLMQKKGDIKKEENLSFSDIETHPCKEEIERVVSAGLMSGYPDGTFHPDQEISLLECIVILSRTLQETEVERTVSIDAPDWARESLQKAISQGLISEQEQNFDQKVSAEELRQRLQNMEIRNEGELIE